jgi:hypothetical protein
MGLPLPVAKQLEQLISHWCSCSGIPWTVQRLKSLKLELLRERAGLPPLMWVRKNRSGYWYGPLGHLQKLASKSKKGFSLAINCLMAYSAFKPGKPTVSHVVSMENSVGTPYQVCSYPDIDVPFSCPDLDLNLIRPLLFLEGSPKIKTPIGLPPKDSVPKSKSFSGELSFFSGMKSIAHVLKYKDFYGPQWKGLGFPSPFGPGLPHLVGGKLVPLDKDGGWKIRWIASPYRIHQEALRPFGNTLYKLLKSVPWDCTFDQTKSIPQLQRVLASGRMVYSVDLKNATDHFPLDLQVQILGRLNSSSSWRKSLSLFVDLSRSAWYYKNIPYFWTKGQPMGLFPSFPAFALSHGILLRYLAKGRTPFFVLGDDVVIWDDKLYEDYRSFLTRFEIPVSEQKSIASTTCCEFAGAMIFKDSVFRSYKWKSYDDNNFLDLMRTFGKRFRKMLTHRQARVYELVKSWQTPLGCNHDVTDLVQSVIDTPDINQDHWRSSVTSFLQWLQSRQDLAKLYSFSGLLSAQEFLDERISNALIDSGFPAWRNSAGALSTVLASHSRDLPHSNPDLGRSTTLEWYENFLSPLGKKYTSKELSLLGIVFQLARRERLEF